MISVCFKGKQFSITVIQIYAQISNAEEAEVEQFYEDLQDLLELTAKKDVLFETASKYCISDSSVDYDGYSISSKGFLPTIVDIMVI